MCTTVLCCCNNIMMCRYVCVPSPVVFFLPQVERGHAGGLWLWPCPPARLSENKLLVKVGQRKGTVLRSCLHPRTTHTRLNQSQYELWANTNAEAFNSSFRRGGNETPAANEARKGGGGDVCLKNNHRRTKNKSVQLNTIQRPVSPPSKGQECDAHERPWKPRRRPVSSWRNAPPVESRRQNTEPDGEASKSFGGNKTNRD